MGSAQPGRENRSLACQLGQDLAQSQAPLPADWSHKRATTPKKPFHYVCENKNICHHFYGKQKDRLIIILTIQSLQASSLLIPYQTDN
jgi:hypothetical protein